MSCIMRPRCFNSWRWAADGRRFSEKMNLVHLHRENFPQVLNPERFQSHKYVYFNNTKITGFDPFRPSKNPARVELPSQKIRLQGEEIKSNHTYFLIAVKVSKQNTKNTPAKKDTYKIKDSTSTEIEGLSSNRLGLD